MEENLEGEQSASTLREFLKVRTLRENLEGEYNRINAMFNILLTIPVELGPTLTPVGEPHGLSQPRVRIATAIKVCFAGYPRG